MTAERKRLLMALEASSLVAREGTCVVCVWQGGGMGMGWWWWCERREGVEGTEGTEGVKGREGKAGRYLIVRTVRPKYQRAKPIR